MMYFKFQIINIRQTSCSCMQKASLPLFFQVITYLTVKFSSITKQLLISLNVSIFGDDSPTPHSLYEDLLWRYPHAFPSSGPKTLWHLFQTRERAPAMETNPCPEVAHSSAWSGVRKLIKLTAMWYSCFMYLSSIHESQPTGLESTWSYVILSFQSCGWNATQPVGCYISHKNYVELCSLMLFKDETSTQS